MILTLTRQYTPFCTFGVLEGPDFKLTTLERPWDDNEPFVSCIPEGIYQCERYSSTRFPDTWEVVDVPGRTHILFHQGNRAIDVSGCIALGLAVDQTTFAITSSAIACQRFMEYTDHEDEFELHIMPFLVEYP